MKPRQAGFPGRVDIDSWLASQRDRFGLLLALLVAAFLLTGVGESHWTRIVGAGLNLAAVAAGFLAGGVRSGRIKFGLVALIGVTGVVLLSAFDPTTVAGGIGALCEAAVLSAVCGVVIRRVITMEKVTMSAIMGGIAGYFLIGLIFAWIYIALRGFVDGPVFVPPAEGPPVYYSFVVLTTLGFGDISPVHELARRLTVVEAMVGQIFLVTLVARLVSMYGTSPRARINATGSKDLDR